MNQSKFNRVWKKHIRPALVDADTEIERKKARWQRVAGIVALASVGGIFFATLLSGDISFSSVETWTVAVWLIGLLVMIIAAVFYSLNDNNFAARFKQAAINGLSGNLTYIVVGNK